MANAPVHKLGQMIGDFIEKYFEAELTEICEERGLYLDVVGRPRKARKGKKVSWFDVYGNKHDLDFVIERNGTDEVRGVPAALIECAWRRYTKHSKNKAQEIQGAVLPIAEKYKYHKPFLGAVIAGVYTAPSVEQLNSCGFETIYFEYSDIITAFNGVGVNVWYDEDTEDAVAEEKVLGLQGLSDDQFRTVFDEIVRLSIDKVNEFKRNLKMSLDRQISQVIIAPLYGVSNVFETVDDALVFISGFDEDTASEGDDFMKLYIQVVYSNNDKVTGEFSNKDSASNFLATVVSA